MSLRLAGVICASNTTNRKGAASNFNFTSVFTLFLFLYDQITRPQYPAPNWPPIRPYPGIKYPAGTPPGYCSVVNIPMCDLHTVKS
eukprot:2841996-Rhodomonas_salina.2